MQAVATDGSETDAETWESLIITYTVARDAVYWQFGPDRGRGWISP